MDLIASFRSPSFVMIHIKRVGKPYGLKIKAKTAVIMPVFKSQKLPGLLKGQPKKYSKKQRIAPIARKKDPILRMIAHFSTRKLLIATKIVNTKDIGNSSIFNNTLT
jgi:hypothetical protein